MWCGVILFFEFDVKTTGCQSDVTLTSLAYVFFALSKIVQQNLPICACSLKCSDGWKMSIPPSDLFGKAHELPQIRDPNKEKWRKLDKDRFLSTWKPQHLVKESIEFSKYVLCCYIPAICMGKKDDNSSSSVLTEKMPGQADDPWVFAPQSSGIGQRNFIQSLGSIGPMGGFKRIWCLGIFCWRKNGAFLITFRVFFLLGIIVNIESWPKRCGFTVISLPKSITVVFQKHVEIVENPQDDFLLLKQCVFHVSKGSSTLTEGFFKKTKLDVIRWRQTSAESPKNVP